MFSGLRPRAPIPFSGSPIPFSRSQYVFGGVEYVFYCPPHLVPYLCPRNASDRGWFGFCSSLHPLTHSSKNSSAMNFAIPIEGDALKPMLDGTLGISAVSSPVCVGLVHQRPHPHGFSIGWTHRRDRCRGRPTTPTRARPAMLLGPVEHSGRMGRDKKRHIRRRS